MSGLIDMGESCYKTQDGKVIYTLFDYGTQRSEEMKALAESYGLLVGMVPIGQRLFYYINEAKHKEYFKRWVVRIFLHGDSNNPDDIRASINNVGSMSLEELTQYCEDVMHYATLKYCKMPNTNTNTNTNIPLLIYT
jgi:hypothetical protein